MRLHVVTILAVGWIVAGCNKKDEPPPEPGAAQQSPVTAGSGGQEGRRHDREHEGDGGGHEGREHQQR